MKILKLGIIGCGRIGSLLEKDPLRGKPCTHAGGFDTIKSIKITAGCDIDRSRLKAFGKQWGVDRLYQSYKDLLRQEALDAVCIAAWTHLHSEMVLESARAGVRGIFCEKPIANTLEDAKKMVHACQRKNIPLVINHERRWDAHYQIARNLIQSGKLGEIRTIVGNALSWKPGKHSVKKFGGGPLFHDGTHLTDLFLFFGGPIDWVSGFEQRPHGKNHIEETACAMIRFRNGAMGFIEGGGARKYFNFELDVQGSEGRLLIGNGGRELYLTKNSRRFTGFHELERVGFPEARRYESPFIGGAKDLIRCIQKQKSSLSSGYDGLKALEIILAIYDSARNSGMRKKISG